MVFLGKLYTLLFKKNKTNNTSSQFFLKNIENAAVVQLPEGLQYQVLIEGNGNKPMITETIKAHYKGFLLSGYEFDNSFLRNEPLTAPIKTFIKGWQIALPMMTEGSIWRLWIPAKLGYGSRGAGEDIPGGATLVFDVQLIEIIK